jgi:hypothetical protein
MGTFRVFYVITFASQVYDSRVGNVTLSCYYPFFLWYLGFFDNY